MKIGEITDTVIGKVTYRGIEEEVRGIYCKYYHEKTNVTLEKLYSGEEASSIMNKNTVQHYKGKIDVKNELSGHSICRLLSDLKEEEDVKKKIDHDHPGNKPVKKLLIK